MSKIEVNTVEPQCGTTLTVGKADTNVAVPSNVVKSNALQASDAGNIIKQCGTTVTLGATGDTIALASGASQTGFGRTGTVDWQTDSIKTATFTATSGEGYFANTTGGAFNMNLPAGAAGSIVSVKDYLNTFDTYALTIVPNGSEKIGGIVGDYGLVIEGLSITLVYVDSTQGWVDIHESTQAATGATFMTASGGTPSTCGNYKIHTFTGPGTFCVSAISTSHPTYNAMDYMVVAGGGGGGGGSGPGTPSGGGGGGGGGGYRESPGTATCYTSSPLGAAPATAVTATVQGYAVVVGAGQPGGTQSAKGTQGGTSSALCISSAGGGGGGYYAWSPNGTNNPGTPGGSGGGGAGAGVPAPVGNDPPTNPAQGTAGGPSGAAGPGWAGSGGGGATVAGSTVGGPTTGGAGGCGATTLIKGPPAPLSIAGGGGGGSTTGGAGNCGGAAGGSGGQCGFCGAINTGGGGGGAGRSCHTGGTSGSGIVIIRYKFQ